MPQRFILVVPQEIGSSGREVSSLDYAVSWEDCLHILSFVLLISLPPPGSCNVVWGPELTGA